MWEQVKNYSWQKFVFILLSMAKSVDPSSSANLWFLGCSFDLLWKIRFLGCPFDLLPAHFHIEGIPPRFPGQKRARWLRILSHSNFSRFVDHLISQYFCMDQSNDPRSYVSQTLLSRLPQDRDRNLEALRKSRWLAFSAFSWRGTPAQNLRTNLLKVLVTKFSKSLCIIILFQPGTIQIDNSGCRKSDGKSESDSPKFPQVIHHGLVLLFRIFILHMT